MTWPLTRARLILYGAIVVSILGLSGYVWWLRSDNESKAEEITKLTEQVDGYVAATETLAKLWPRYADHAAKADEVDRLLDRHDVGHLAESKPDLLARRINRGTQRMLDDIEAVTARSDSRP